MIEETHVDLLILRMVYSVQDKVVVVVVEVDVVVVHASLIRKVSALLETLANSVMRMVTVMVVVASPILDRTVAKERALLFKKVNAIEEVIADSVMETNRQRDLQAKEMPLAKVMDFATSSNLGNATVVMNVVSFMRSVKFHLLPVEVFVLLSRRVNVTEVVLADSLMKMLPVPQRMSKRDFKFLA